jgi:hypothetical protein
MRKITGIIVAIVGLVLTGLILFAAIRFYRTISNLAQNNPAISRHDTLHTVLANDTLLDRNAGLNQQIAQKLTDKPEEDKSVKQRLLHQTIFDFILLVDTLEQVNLPNETTLLRLKHAVNKTNMGCRSALFDIADVALLPELDSFLIVDEKKLGNTIFECFSAKEIKTACFKDLKHYALRIENLILEKNFKRLNL